MKRKSLRLSLIFASFLTVFGAALLVGRAAAPRWNQIVRKQISVPAPSPAPAPTPAPPGVADLQQKIQAILTRDHVPGAGIALVAKDHIIWAGGVGEARLPPKTPVTADTMFRVGSISKTFIALALLQLQQQGKIDLNAQLSSVAPTLPFRNPWAATDPVTVAEVLEHTAGFDDMLPSEVYNLSGREKIDPFDVCKLFPQTLVSRWPPGTRMAYSNPDYGVAGYLIWKASYLQFDQYIEQSLLPSLGMNASGFTLTDKIYAQLAQGYDGVPPKPVPYLHIYLRPAGDFKSSPAELANLVQMFLNDGKVGNQEVVSPASIERMEYPQTTLAARAGLKYGYGFGDHADLSGPVVEFGHDGGIAGFLSSYRYMPDQGVGYVALINSDSGGPALQAIDRLLANFLLAGKTLPAPPTASIPPDQLEKFTGYYEKENPRDQLTAFRSVLFGGEHVSLSNGVLYMKQGWLDPSQALVPTGGNQFRLADQAAASMIFFTGPSGREILAATDPNSFFGERRSEWWPLTRFILVHLALLLIASSFLFALWWVPRKLLGKLKGTPAVGLRLMPVLAGLSLAGIYPILAWTPIWYLGVYNMASVGVWLLTWLFAAFSVLGIILAWRAFWEPVHRGVLWYSLIVSIACCGLTIYLAYWHLLGIELWKL